MNIKETGSTRGYASKRVQLNISKIQLRKETRRWNISKNKHILNYRNIVKAAQEAKEGLDSLMKKFNMNEEIKRIQKKRFQTRVAAARMRQRRRNGGKGVEEEDEDEEESENTSVSSYNSDDDDDSEVEEEDEKEVEEEVENDEGGPGGGRGRREVGDRGVEVTNGYRMKLRCNRNHNNNDNAGDSDYDGDNSNENIKIKKEVEGEEEEVEEDGEGRENESFDDDEHYHNRTCNTRNDNENKYESENENEMGRRVRVRNVDEDEDHVIGWGHIGQKRRNLESNIPFNIALKLKKLIKKDRLYDMRHSHTYSQKMKNNRKLRRAALIDFGKILGRKKLLDDNKGLKYEESVRNRYKVYADNMLPLLNELGRSGVLEVNDHDDDNNENNANNKNNDRNRDENKNRYENRKGCSQGIEEEEEEEDEDEGFLQLIELDLKKRMNRGRGDEVENSEDVGVRMMERKGMRQGEETREGKRELKGEDGFSKDYVRGGEEEDVKGRRAKGAEENGEEKEGVERERQGVEVEVGVGEVEHMSHRGPRREKYTMENIPYGAFDHQYGRPVKSYAHRNRYVHMHVH